MRKRGKDAYDYIGTHVDDLMVVSMDVKGIFKELEIAYTFKTTDTPKYHSGVDYHYVEGKGSKGTYHVGSGTYVKEALTKVEDGIQNLMTLNFWIAKSIHYTCNLLGLAFGSIP